MDYRIVIVIACIASVPREFVEKVGTRAKKKQKGMREEGEGSEGMSIFTNEPNREISRGVFQNRGVYGQAFPLLPSPSPFHFIYLFFCSRSNFDWKRLLRRLWLSGLDYTGDGPKRPPTWGATLRTTQVAKEVHPSGLATKQKLLPCPWRRSEYEKYEMVWYKKCPYLVALEWITR